MTCRRALAVLALAVLVLAPACGSPEAGSQVPAQGASGPHGPYAVGRRSIVLVDHSRSTPADPQRGLPAQPERVLPVMLLYPALGRASPDGAPVTGARPEPGRFPIVVFSHGITASGPLYSPLVQVWARAGYVIAAPTFPRSGPGAIFPGDTVDLDDYMNQPGDVSFVLTSILDGRGGSAFLRPHIDPSEVAAAGHSLGAITTLGLVYNSCCIDKRVKAAVSLSGIELPYSGGSYSDPPPTPLLLVHGAEDQTVPIGAGSDAIFKVAKAPVYYLRFTDANHVDVPFSPTYAPWTDTAAIAFLNRYLKGDHSGLAKLPGEVARSGLGTWQQKLPRH